MANAQMVTGAGYFFASEKTTGSDKAVAHHGFYLGASYNVPIVAGLGVAPGIYFDMLTYSRTANDGASWANYYINGRYREFAVNVPINVNYKLNLGSNAALVAYAGPTFQVGISSTTTVTGEVNILGYKASDGEKYNHYDSEHGDRKRFNMSVGGGLGFEVGDILFTVGYDRSLINYLKNDDHKASRNMIKAGINFAF
jgi:hypothetical protein